MPYNAHMRRWSLRAGDPLALTIAADARLCTPDYADDQVWQLDLEEGEPSALGLSTSLGLRARRLRLYYRLGEADHIITDPRAYFGAPCVTDFHTSAISVSAQPFDGIRLDADHWAAESHAITGRVTLGNLTDRVRRITFDLCAFLLPLEGNPFGPGMLQRVNVIMGSTSGFEPVIFMGTAPNEGAGPHCALSVSLVLEPSQSRTISWACAALPKAADSFALARKLAGRTWESEKARIEMLDSRDLVEITTGDPDWDAALAFGQTAGQGLLMAAKDRPESLTAVRTRQPDTGYSRSGTGLDYPTGWTGTSPLETAYLINLLPGIPALPRLLLDRFLIEAPDGRIDNRPGPAGQRSNLLAQPMLASLVLRAADTGAAKWFEHAYPTLLAFFHRWLKGQETPSWQHVLQTGFDNNPLFDAWDPWSQAVPINALSNPQLEAMLIREGTALAEIAERIGLPTEARELRELVAGVSQRLSADWDAAKRRFAYRELASGQIPDGQRVVSIKGNGAMQVQVTELPVPARLVIELHAKDAPTFRPAVELFGNSGKGETARTERITAKEFRGRAPRWIALTARTYTSLQSITVKGIGASDKVVIHTIDASQADITLLTPLWAGAASEEQARAIAAGMHKRGGMLRQYGVPMLSKPPSATSAENTRATALLAERVQPLWNAMVIEGLLHYGLRADAADLLTRVMSGIISELKTGRAFRDGYHSHTGEGIGERGSLNGMPPVGTFLRVLGVQLLSPASVHLEGANPFPWPVTLIYRGVHIARGLSTTVVTFANGRTETVTDPAPRTLHA